MISGISDNYLAKRDTKFQLVSHIIEVNLIPTILFEKMTYSALQQSFSLYKSGKWGLGSFTVEGSLSHNIFSVSSFYHNKRRLASHYKNFLFKTRSITRQKQMCLRINHVLKINIYD